MALNIKAVDMSDSSSSLLSQAKVNDLIVSYAKDFSSMTAISEGDLVVHLKRYEQDGKRTKFSITARLVGGGLHLKSESHAWTLAIALREALEALKGQWTHNRGRTIDLHKDKKMLEKKKLFRMRSY